MLPDFGRAEGYVLSLDKVKKRLARYGFYTGKKASKHSIFTKSFIEPQ
jgi:hypothetical protein